MKKDQLAKPLQKNYQKGSETGGGERGLDPSLKNSWFVVMPPPPATKPARANLEQLGQANQILQTLPKIDEVSDLDQLALSLLVKREAVASSRMEGTWSTIDHVLTPSGLLDGENKGAHASVRGYAHVLEKNYSITAKKGVEIFTKDLLRTIHKEIMRLNDQPRGTPGKFRFEENPPRYVWIGGSGRLENSIFNPSPPRYVNEQLGHFFDWIRNKALQEMSLAGQGPSPLVRWAISHAFFEGIHPFVDGNGRVGRTLSALQMVADRFSPIYLSSYIELHKEAYVTALGAAQKKLDYAPIVDFWSEAVIQSWSESQKTKSALTSLPQQWLGRGQFRKGSSAYRLLSILIANPIVSGPQIQTKLKISKPAAYRALDQLVKKQVIRERTGFGRNRVFAAEEVIQILARPFDEPISIAQEKAREVLNL